MLQIRSCDKLPFAHKVNFSLKLFYERSTLLRICVQILVLFLWLPPAGYLIMTQTLGVYLTFNWVSFCVFLAAMWVFCSNTIFYNNSWDKTLCQSNSFNAYNGTTWTNIHGHIIILVWIWNSVGEIHMSAGTFINGMENAHTHTHTEVRKCMWYCSKA